MDAACIDLKGFDPKFYQALVDAELEPVFNTLKTLRRKKVHLEIVNLVIPQLNDKPQTISDMCAWNIYPVLRVLPQNAVAASGMTIPRTFFSAMNICWICQPIKQN